MTYTKTYPGKINSPELVLTAGIDAVVTTIVVTGQINKLPAAPNLFVIGTGEDAETIYYPTDATGAGPYTFTGVTREFDLDPVSGHGAAKAWTAGEVVGRNFTAYDYHSLRTGLLQQQQKPIVLYPLGAKIPVTDGAALDQRELTNGINVFYGEYPAGTSNKLQWTQVIPSELAGNTFTVSFEFMSYTAAMDSVQLKLYGIRAGDGGTRDLTVLLLATVDSTNAGSDKTRVTGESAPFSITGTGNTVEFEVRRGTDAFTGNVELLAVRITPVV